LITEFWDTVANLSYTIWQSNVAGWTIRQFPISFDDFHSYISFICFVDAGGFSIANFDCEGYTVLPGKLTKRCGKPTVSRSMKHDLQQKSSPKSSNSTGEFSKPWKWTSFYQPNVLNRGVKHQEHGSTLVEG